MAWIQRWQPRPTARLRLLCLPYAGGSALAYQSWAGQLPEDIEVLAAELPGHGSRYGEPWATSMGSVIEALLAELAPLLAAPARSLAVYGHSMGALLALELARGIRRQTGRPPLALLVSGSAAPAEPAAAGTLGLPGTPDPAEPDPAGTPDLLELPDSHWRGLLAANGRLAPGVLADDRLMDTALSMLRADLVVLAGYRYRAEEPLGCPVRLYTGISDDTVPEAELAGWQRECPRDFRLSKLPGGHFFIRECEPLYLARLAADLAEIRTAINGVRR